MAPNSLPHMSIYSIAVCLEKCHLYNPIILKQGHVIIIDINAAHQFFGQQIFVAKSHWTIYIYVEESYTLYTIYETRSLRDTQPADKNPFKGNTFFSFHSQLKVKGAFSQHTKIPFLRETPFFFFYS